MSEVEWWELLINLFYNNYKGYWVKAEMFVEGGDIEGVTSPCLPHKNFNRAHTGTNSKKAWSVECIDNKIYSESFIENILPTKYLHGRNQCQVQFYKPFSSLQQN